MRQCVDAGSFDGSVPNVPAPVAVADIAATAVGEDQGSPAAVLGELGSQLAGQVDGAGGVGLRRPDSNVTVGALDALSHGQRPCLKIHGLPSQRQGLVDPK